MKFIEANIVVNIFDGRNVNTFHYLLRFLRRNLRLFFYFYFGVGIYSREEIPFDFTVGTPSMWKYYPT